MRRNEILEQIFEALHISEPFYMASYINQNPLNILDKINFEEYGDKYEKRDKVDISKSKIVDDNEVKKITVNFKSIPFEFEFYHKKDSVYYHLYTNETKAPGVCLLIIINKINNTCTINNISAFDRCFPVYIDKKDKTGSIILKLALQLIKKLKDHYKLTKVFLTDNSMKLCKNHRIELHKMLTLLTGTTWYGKHGFIPVEEFFQDRFKKNKKIMDKLLLKDVPKLKSYIIKAHKKAKSKENIEEILRNYDEAVSKNALLSKYLNYFLHNYDDNCEIFYYFYEDLYFKLGLLDMRGKEFYLRL
jgi:hypothetical protein